MPKTENLIVGATGPTGTTGATGAAGPTGAVGPVLVNQLYSLNGTISTSGSATILNSYFYKTAEMDGIVLAVLMSVNNTAGSARSILTVNTISMTLITTTSTPTWISTTADISSYIDGIYPITFDFSRVNTGQAILGGAIFIAIG